MPTIAFPAAAAIITAGGIGRRLGGAVPKQFLPLLGRPVLIHTLHAFVQAGCFQHLVLTVPSEHQPTAERLLAEHGLRDSCRIVAGGPTRQESVWAGLTALPAEVEMVVVHDGVRPLVDRQIIVDCLQAAQETGAAIAAVPVKDTLKRDHHGHIQATVERSGLWRAQTPQAARLALLRQAYEAARRDNFSGTDESSLLERIGCPVALVSGSERNIKITLAEDIAVAEALLQTNPHPAPTLRVGHGYDAHRLVTGRHLILGGVTIPHPTGLLGHSDADVLTHSLCDALLGALGQGDLGRHFPDSDPTYRGINSLKLLARVVTLAAEQGFRLGNADLTIVAQRPKLAPHLPQMQKNLAEVCQVSPAHINIKATTTEGMGFSGREEGVASHAVVLLERQSVPC